MFIDNVTSALLEWNINVTTPIVNNPPRFMDPISFDIYENLTNGAEVGTLSILDDSGKKLAVINYTNPVDIVIYSRID